MRKPLGPIRRIVEWYHRSWMGQPTQVTNGRITAVSVAVLVLCIFVPYSLRADAKDDDRRACLSRARSGQEIQASALEGVAHAEETAELMDSLITIFATARTQAGAGPSQAWRDVRAEVDAYAASVAKFRQVAEQYTPTTYADCVG